MIQYIKRKDLDVEKYDFCIKNSYQSRVYAFSWYLDIVADNWSVLVLDDYKAVMPIPWKMKYFIKYVYPPFWLLELGVFSLDDNTEYQSFFKVLFQKFRFVESRLNTDNKIEKDDKYFLNKQMQSLSLNTDYNLILKNYRKDRKKDLSKARKADLTEKWNDNPENLIQLFKNNVGKRTPNIQKENYVTLGDLIQSSIAKKVGEVLSIYDNSDNLVASAFFFKHKKTVTILVSSTDFKNRKNGANTFLIDRAIYKYSKNFNVFNFGGSSMDSIAKYFLSFGAETKEYSQIKLNKLPLWLRLFKK